MPSGEEDEDVLLKMRAKIYRWSNNEWKERGKGDIKILQNKENKNKIRIISR